MTIDQEAENVAASVLHLLTQRGKDAENWQRQAKDWEATATALRRELDALTLDLFATRREAAALSDAYNDLARQLAEAQRRIAELEIACGFPHSHK